MIGYRLVLAARAEAQLLDIWDWIAGAASAEVANGFAARLLDRCLSLDTFPQRGTPRDDLRPGLRTIPFRRAVTIGYVIERSDVVVVSLAYQGQALADVLPNDGP